MTKSKKGGTREGAGRPRLEAEEQRQINIRLSDRLKDKAAVIGSGSVSAGIRKALDEYEEKAALVELLAKLRSI